MDIFITVIICLKITNSIDIEKSQPHTIIEKTFTASLICLDIFLCNLHVLIAAGEVLPHLFHYFTISCISPFDIFRVTRTRILANAFMMFSVYRSECQFSRRQWKYDVAWFCSPPSGDRNSCQLWVWQKNQQEIIWCVSQIANKNLNIMFSMVNYFLNRKRCPSYVTEIFGTTLIIIKFFLNSKFIINLDHLANILYNGDWKWLFKLSF